MGLGKTTRWHPAAGPLLAHAILASPINVVPNYLLDTKFSRPHVHLLKADPNHLSVFCFGLVYVPWEREGCISLLQRLDL